MPRQKFALESGAAKRLELAWGWQWRKLTVYMDDAPIGSFANKTQLVAGQTFSLDDGASLEVRLVEKFSYPNLHILRNGRLLPGLAASIAWRRLGLIYALTLVLIAGGLTAANVFVIPHIKEYVEEVRKSQQEGQEGQEGPEGQERRKEEASQPEPNPELPPAPDTPDASQPSQPEGV